MIRPGSAAFRSLAVRLLFVFCACSASAMELYLAPFSVTGTVPSAAEQFSPQQDLLSVLNTLDYRGAAVIKKLAGRQQNPVEGVLDAAEVCNGNGIAYLLFGYIEQNELSLDCELRLFDNATKKVVKTFFARDAADEYSRLVDELGRKILEYLYSDIGLVPYESPREPDRNIFMIPLYLNYWSPGGAGWGEITTGIVRLESGLLLTPRRPMFMKGKRPWEFDTGLTLAYSLAVNDGEYESFVLHSLRLNLPLEAVLGLTESQSFAFGGGVSMQFDLLQQDRLYYGSYSAFSASPGWFLEAGYRYRLTPRWSLGFRTVLEFTFFDPLETSVAAGFSGLYEFDPLKPSGN